MLSPTKEKGSGFGLSTSPTKDKGQINGGTVTSPTKEKGPGFGGTLHKLSHMLHHRPRTSSLGHKDKHDNNKGGIFILVVNIVFILYVFA